MFSEIPAMDKFETVYACELERNDRTNFGTVDHIERYVTAKGQERVRVYMQEGMVSSVKADSTWRVKLD